MIGISIPSLSNGGTEIQTYALVKALKQLSGKVHMIVYFTAEKNIQTRFEALGVEVTVLNLPKRMSPFYTIVELWNVIKRLNLKTLHVQYMAPGALPIIAAKLAGVPRIFATVHQPWTPAHKLRNKYILRAAALLCDRFTVVSQNAERSWFGSANLIDPSKPIANQSCHLTLYNAVDVDKLQSIRNSFAAKPDLGEIGIPADATVIGSVSRLRHEKGVDVLIHAFADLAIDVNGSNHLVLVGDGPDRQQLKDQAKMLDVQDRIHFMGALSWEASMRWMAQMDIVVVPSRFEGFGLTAAEAMAMGKPVVVANTFGLTELVEDGSNGLVFNNGDRLHLTQQLRLLLSDSAMAARLAVNAAETIRTRFDLATYQRNIAALYEIKEQ